MINAIPLAVITLSAKVCDCFVALDELFSLVDCKELKYEITIKSKDDIYNLFTMTPYYYKTSKEDTEKLLKLEKLTTTVHFAIEIYKKVG